MSTLFVSSISNEDLDLLLEYPEFAKEVEDKTTLHFDDQSISFNKPNVKINNTQNKNDIQRETHSYRPSVLKQNPKNINGEKHQSFKSYSCRQCTKSFSEKCTLKRHIMIHMNEKPYSCKHCLRSFSRKFTLKGHEKLHTSEKQFIREEKSEDIVGNINEVDFQKFSVQEDSKMPYSDAYIQELHKNGLISHTKSVHEVAQYPCEKCNSKFTKKQALYRHIQSVHEKVHTSENQFIREEKSEDIVININEVDFQKKSVQEDSKTPYSDATETLHNPQEIKRPMNAFMIFLFYVRKNILKDASNVHNREINKSLGKKWKMLTEETKLPYIQEAKRLQDFHKIEYPNYKYQPKRTEKPYSCKLCFKRFSKKFCLTKHEESVHVANVSI